MQTNQLAGGTGEGFLCLSELGCTVFMPFDQSLTIKPFRKLIKVWQQDPKLQLISVVHASEQLNCAKSNQSNRSVLWYRVSKYGFCRQLPTANKAALTGFNTIVFFIYPMVDMWLSGEYAATRYRFSSWPVTDWYSLSIYLYVLYHANSNKGLNLPNQVWIFVLAVY